MKKITVLFILLTNWAGFAQNFVDVTNSLPQLGYSFSAWGDYDSDGDLDLFFTGVISGSTYGGGLYQNNQGSFTLVTNSGLPTLQLGGAEWGDFNNDGYPDIVITGFNSNNQTQSDVYLNNGNGTFTAANSGIAKIEYGDVAVADINGDGHLDIGIAGFDTNVNTSLAKLYTGDGQGHFTQLNVILPPIIYGRIKFADYDNDGDMDFILNGQNNATGAKYTKIWANDGQEHFTEQNLNLPNIDLGDVEWGDVDNDNDLDLVITGSNGTNSVSYLMLNNGDGTFTQASGFNVVGAEGIANIELKDFNNDQTLDIFITGESKNTSPSTPVAKIYNNTGGAFTENTSMTNLPAVIYGDADAADYDHDGSVDLFVTGVDLNYNNKSKLFHNEIAGSVEKTVLSKFDIYPNPVNSILHIQSKNYQEFDLSINDLTGKTVYKNNAVGGLQINVTDFPRGIYLLKITLGGEQMVKKLIVK
ncbi:MAG TPA: T9SS type A sorting domain-containing protein [Flavobacteriales bacterium]|nr:T9SS type A sorting domain-containing protein [Flavobacteriales bacterium]